MKLYEYNAKELFRKEGIPTPDGGVAKTPEDVEKIARRLGKSVAIKSQILIGGRGKAGGIRFAENPESAYKVGEELLSSSIKGERIDKVLVEEKIPIEREFYVGIIVDRAMKKPLIMASSEGGVEIEELASEHPEKIIKYYVDPLGEFLPYEAREIARKMGIEGKLISQVGGIIWRLYNLFRKYDALLAEINPLALSEGNLIAVDAKLEIDDDSIFRHPELREQEEYEASEFAFVKLDGNIAVIGNGAGLTLTAMDLIKLQGGEPATFLDIGGGASPEIIRKAINHVISYPKVDVVFLNVLGGITRADDVAKGVVEALKDAERDIPLVIRLTGTNEEEGQRILKEAGIPFETSLEKAAAKAVEIARKL
ncbi:ADP-forming succinate--CoA ligase subunit beta [Methanothermobacter tenebrarum]|uniref:Succinate--CoA ligase [ADP-forming] subunit beta n=1 Tax=Methanothermobacter tenebrarum TaxID=680118 RepID=A0A328PHG5_9EURY|nr:ADP-forming succinate--CoA ligase subunit beta [Methanothermobacter tenebrarum]MBC7100260.1 ADP-forming succinate--CoA ligase subunit beta [Methanobacteriales archaeon]MBC7118421.1 ADP-forming succinate--CoA ligase subunit beta [Methanobacteriaceae archaeon]NPV65046.1 ADP-forming succinate--CoA ligase subunit beta [Methanobacteriaceae archaeon]RAO79275.1 ADP-forming succinate--CoA ligase subunit beta [Methanothermobacter tenebrarum]